MCPTVLDATHSVQLPGTLVGKSGGQCEFVSNLAFAALAAGANGLFSEMSFLPDDALRDGHNVFELSDLHGFSSTSLSHCRHSHF